MCIATWIARFYMLRFAWLRWLEKMSKIFPKWWVFHGDEYHGSRIRTKSSTKQTLVCKMDRKKAEMESLFQFDLQLMCIKVDLVSCQNTGRPWIMKVHKRALSKIVWDLYFPTKLQGFGRPQGVKYIN